MNVETRVHAPPVPGRLASMDLTFELHFTVPLFDLPERRADLLRALHDTLPAPFAFDTDDIGLSQGDTLSEFRVSVSVLYGKAKIVISPESIEMSFFEMPRIAFLNPSRRVFESAQQAVTNFSRDAEITLTSISVFLRVDLDQEYSARDHLNNACQSRLLDFSGFGNTLQYHEIKFDIRDEDDSWSVSCHARGDLKQESRLNVSFLALYNEDGRIDGLEDKTNHLERLVTDLLPQIGVNMP